jgi:hypothetical protein
MRPITFPSRPCMIIVADAVSATRQKASFLTVQYSKLVFSLKCAKLPTFSHLGVRISSVGSSELTIPFLTVTDVADIVSLLKFVYATVF